MTRRSRKVSFPHVVIRASAGTGKTFQLSNRYLALLHADVEPERILATTFTRKAAGEILDRVVMRLAEAATNASACAELANFLNDQSLSPARCAELLHHLLQKLHRVRIGTLDSFFAQLARSLSLEIGLPIGWRIIDELEDHRLRDEAIEAVIHKAKTGELLTLTHLLTKGETRRGVAQLVREAVLDMLEVFQESDETAWHKLPRFKPLSEPELALIVDELRELRFDDARFTKARDADHQRILAGDWDELISKGLGAKVLAGETTYFNKPLGAETSAVYSRLLDHAKALLVMRVAMQTEGSCQLLSKFDGEYCALKHAHAAARFGDITRCLGRTFSSAAALDSLATSQRRLTLRLDGALHHLLLDEFQDTAPLQWTVLQPFTQSVTDKAGSGSFFCVGDTKQAIYGWRGGVAELFDAVSEELRDLETRGLNASFRSAPPVIETVNRVFQSLLSHPNLGRAEAAATRWQQTFPLHTTERTNLPGYVVLAAVSDAETLVDFAAQRVVELHLQAPHRSIGVLVRRNDMVRRLIALLRARGVMASEEGGNPLTDSVAVQMVLSLLRLGDHPGDGPARFHVAESPLGSALGYKDYRDHGEALRLSRRVRQTILEQGYGAAIATWSSYLEPHATPRERSRLRQLGELAFQYQANATARLDDFVKRVEHQRVADPTAAPVRVMTIHQAKGLEFDIVVLPELQTKLMGQPGSFAVGRETPAGPIERVCRAVNQDVRQFLPRPFQQMFEAAEDQTASESLCVLYVALTRAVHALHMLIAPAKPNERQLPATYEGLLRATLGDGGGAVPGQILYEAGDRNWHAAGKPKRGTEPSRTVPERSSVLVQLAPSERWRRRGWERTSPSQREGGSHVSFGSVLRPQPSAALLRGTIIHAWFEQVRWLDDGVPNENLLRQIAAEALRKAQGSLDIDQVLRDFSKMLQQPAIAAALSPRAYDSRALSAWPPTARQMLSNGGTRLVIEAERGFALRWDGQLVAGSIDRLVWLYAGERLVAADILDFKTDALDDGDTLSSKTEYYRPQLEAYRRAVCQMSNLAADHVQTRLLFVGLGLTAMV